MERHKISALQRDLSTAQTAVGETEKLQRRFSSLHEAFEKAATEISALTRERDTLEDRKREYKNAMSELSRLVQRQKEKLTLLADSEEQVKSSQAFENYHILYFSFVYLL